MGSSFSSIGHSMTRRAVTGGGTSQPWLPSDLNVRLWIDADDSSTISLSGSTIVGVTDKASVHSFNIGNTPTIVTNGLNNRDVMDFSGSNEYIQSSTYYLSITGGNHFAIGVFRYDNTNSTGDSFWSIETNASAKRDYAMSSGASNNTWPGEIDLDGLGTTQRISTTIGNAQQWNLIPSLSRFTYYIVGCYFNKTGNQIGVRVNGDNAFTPVNDYDNALSPYQQLRLMRNRSSQELDGRVAEIFWINEMTGTSGTDMSYFEKAEGYLAHKWGLAGSLPSSHPYKSTAP